QELPQEQDAAQPPRAALVAYFSRMQEAPEDEYVPDPVTALAQWIAALTGGDIHAPSMPRKCPWTRSRAARCLPSRPCPWSSMMWSFWVIRNGGTAARPRCAAFYRRMTFLTSRLHRSA